MPLGPNAEKFRQALVAKTAAVSSAEVTDFNIAQLRKDVNDYFSKLLSGIPKKNDGVTIEKMALNIDDHHINIIIYRPANLSNRTLPVVIFHPGGGLALDMAELHGHACATMCLEAEAAVVCVQPALAPEKKLPEILDAAYKATKYFYVNAEQYHFDKEKFIISGYSMGGTLAVLIAIRSCKDNELKIKYQVIISGVFNLAQPPLTAGEDFMFSPSTHLKFVEMCLPEGGKIHDLDRLQFSPLTINKDISQLPSVYLITSDCDVFQADSEAIYHMLKRKGVDVEISIIPGQIHNTLLLFPIMGDGKNPAVLAGEQIKKICARRPQAKL